MTFVAVAIGGAALVGAGASMYGANKQAGAARSAAGLQASQYGQTRGDLSQFMIGGGQANQALIAGLGLGTINEGNFAPGQLRDPNAALTKPFSLADFQQSPAYQFNLQQGQMAIDKGANARGNYYAPQTLQDLSRFSQGLASNEFNTAYNQYNQNQANIYNRLSGLAGSGQNAAAGLGGFGAASATNQGNFLTGGAAAKAGGIQGAGMSLSQLAYLPMLLAQQQQGTSWNPAGNFGYDPTGGYGAQNMYLGPPQ